MKTNYISNLFFLPFFSILSLLNGCNPSTSSNEEKTDFEAEYYSLDDFGSVKKYDVHVHLRKDFDTLFIHQAEKDNFRLMNLSVYSASGLPPEKQEEFSVQLARDFPETISYGTTFSLQNFGTENWEKETVDYLKNSFDKGAIAVKVWKNIGMELKDADGTFVMIDDVRFDPVLEFIAEQDITLIGHLGEPRNTWLPIEEMTVQGDIDYFSENPNYHMYNFPEFPSYEDHIQARDNMLEKHPSLRFVGAHLGSLEYNVDELAKRLDRFPSMAVDMAERISHLQYQAITNWQGVHDFLIKYQDRLIYGTDLRTSASDIVKKGLTDPEEIKIHAHEVWLRHWKFFTSDEWMEVPKVEGKFKGMKLPREVIDKIYRKNAENWFPGLLEGK